MVRPWPPMTFRCKSCGWQTTTQGSSDAMRVGIDVFVECPTCDSEAIDRREATRAEILWARMRPKR